MCISLCQIGPAFGSALYILGGFPLPFVSVGTFGLLVSISAYFVVPDVQAKQTYSPNDNRKILTLWGIAKVFILMMLLNIMDLLY